MYNRSISLLYIDTCDVMYNRSFSLLYIDTCDVMYNRSIFLLYIDTCDVMYNRSISLLPPIVLDNLFGAVYTVHRANIYKISVELLHLYQHQIHNYRP